MGVALVAECIKMAVIPHNMCVFVLNLLKKAKSTAFPLSTLLTRTHTTTYPPTHTHTSTPPTPRVGSSAHNLRPATTNLLISLYSLQLHTSHTSTHRVGLSALSLRSAATKLLSDLKLLRFHEPIELRRAGLDPSDLSPNLVAKAKVIRRVGGRGEGGGERREGLNPSDLPPNLIASGSRQRTAMRDR